MCGWWAAGVWLWKSRKHKHALRTLWLCGWFTIIWELKENIIYYQLIYFLVKSVFVMPNIWVKNTKALESPLQKFSLYPSNYSIKIVGCFVRSTTPLFRKFIHIYQYYHRSLKQLECYKRYKQRVISKQITFLQLGVLDMRAVYNGIELRYSIIVVTVAGD